MHTDMFMLTQTKYYRFAVFKIHFFATLSLNQGIYRKIQFQISLNMSAVNVIKKGKQIKLKKKKSSKSNNIILPFKKS